MIWLSQLDGELAGWLTAEVAVSGGWLTVSRGRGRAREPRERKGGRRRGSQKRQSAGQQDDKMTGQSRDNNQKGSGQCK